jgi:hypothetical protein
MKLEVNEQTVTENCTPDDLKQLDFTQTACLQEGLEHYLQVWVDEDDNGNELYYRVAGGQALTCPAPDELDVATFQAIFTKFLGGDQSWSDQFEWSNAPEPGDDGVLIDPEFELGEDRWEVYPCQFEDGATAMVVYDHAISLEMDSIELSQFVGVKVELESPDESGLSTAEEDEKLEDYEEALATAVVDLDGVYLGHITFEGGRHFYFYLDQPAAKIEEILSQFNDESAYQGEFVLETDPEKTRYWNELYPPEEGLNLILDAKLVHSHEDMGDHVQAPRLVEFWVDFPKEDLLAEFEAWANNQSYTVSRQSPPESADDPFSVIVGKEIPIELPDVNAVSSEIFAKAKELDGEYVGWECGIVEAV